MTLAYGVLAGGGVCARVGWRVLDLSGLDEPLAEGSLNAFMARGREYRSEITTRIEGEGRLVEQPQLAMPFEVADYVDFYSSLEHATNLGRMFRPDSDPLLPNWRELPVGYHGRAGSIVVTGTPVTRPRGQLPAEPRPAFGPTQRLDIELELGFLTGPPGTRISTAQAAGHVFGFVLVNDWSARDIQRWEYQPLGPFLGKSFATSISAWVTPLEALDAAWTDLPGQDPTPLPYLTEGSPRGLDIAVEVEVGGDAACPAKREPRARPSTDVDEPPLHIVK
ncbi:MAG: fumarylacetoacetate hydrolase family protein [Thermoleophilia bacterium]